jgi:hypothetical protein
MNNIEEDIPVAIKKWSVVKLVEESGEQSGEKKMIDTLKKWLKLKSTRKNC